MAEYHHCVTPRERGTTEVWCVQLVPESMGERESGVFDFGLGEAPASWSVYVDDFLGCTQLAIEYVGEDGFLNDWNGGPG